MGDRPERIRALLTAAGYEGAVDVINESDSEENP